jgi:O-antigen biosynthesis protein
MTNLTNPSPSLAVPTVRGYARPRVEGKFLYVGNEKYFICGVTYGAFPPNSRGPQFPEPPEVAKDCALMRAAGINTILTYTVPPISLLDQAQEHGLRVITVVPWMEYVCFLEDPSVRKKMLREVKEGVASCRRHPAVMMYCVGKEIPPPIVRWHGRKRVEEFLQELYHVAKDEDPDSLVTYTSFPTTEYLELSFVDVYTFNVYLHQRSDLCKYVSRLQHLAGELPLILTELGMCSFRHGREGQAAFLDWQIEEVFDHGLAGAVVFGWTDPFFQDGGLVTEWGFGLVDAERRPKPSYETVRRRFTTGVPFPAERQWPKVSVIVAAHNSARTLEDCLDSIQKLRYPDYEVIVVNDGSTDATEAIMNRFPFRNITTPNQGVGGARNVGLREATGEIVAYIDSDARADPDWLRYLATTFLKFDVAGVGGPNLIPPEDNWLAKCVYRSPGGPTQVMLDDQLAEHIPGCNMSFRKAALEDIGGFDPRFTTAADDVDICWRLLEKGYKISFSPSAVVWHHRRPSVKAYWRQQVGYGLSESILEKKFPNKFNPWGHTFWAGRIYAPYPFFRLRNQSVIYHGVWGSAPFQPMYEPRTASVFTFLPRAMELHVILGALLVLGVFFPWALILIWIGFGYTGWYCATCASQARLDVLGRGTEPQQLKWRLTIAWLHFLEPLARDWGRLRGGLTPWRTVPSEPGSIKYASPWWERIHPFERIVRWTIPGTMALEKYPFLDLLLEELVARGYAVGWNPPSQDWDLKFRRGALEESELRMVVEHHGGWKRLARLSAAIRQPRAFYWLHSAVVALILIMFVLDFPLSATALGAGLVLTWIVSVREANRLEAAALSAAAEVATRLEWESRRGTGRT